MADENKIILPVETPTGSSVNDVERLRKTVQNLSGDIRKTQKDFGDMNSQVKRLADLTKTLNNNPFVSGLSKSGVAQMDQLIAKMREVMKIQGTVDAAISRGSSGTSTTNSVTRGIVADLKAAVAEVDRLQARLDTISRTAKNTPVQQFFRNQSGGVTEANVEARIKAQTLRVQELNLAGQQGTKEYQKQLDLLNRLTEQQARFNQVRAQQAQFDKDFLAGQRENARIDQERQKNFNKIYGAANAENIARDRKSMDQKTRDDEAYNRMRIRADAENVARDIANQKRVAAEQQNSNRMRMKADADNLRFDQQRIASYERMRRQADADNLRFDQQQARKAAAPENIRANRREILFGDNGASLFDIQARLLVNFKIISALTNTIGFAANFVKEFEQNLRRLQAITGASEPELNKLRDSILGISTAFQFAAKDVAEATILLAQAGLSAAQIDKVLKPVLTLASATGTDLKTAVDVATSAMSVFNLRADEMQSLADNLASALNRTKLNMDQVQLALQYIGSTAAESNISFNELLAVIGQIANAGIRSGSTIGTGLRQLIVDISAPSTALKKELDRLGLSIEDVNIKTLGFTGVLRRLKDAGFDSSSAFAGLERRAANVFLAIRDRVDDIELDRQINLLQGDATKAAGDRLKSFADQFERLKNSFGALISNMSGPFLNALTQITKGLADVFAYLSKIDTVWLSLFGTAALSALSGRLLVFFGGLAANLLRITGLWNGVALAAARANAVQAAAGTGGGVAAGAAGLARFIPGVGTALAIGTVALTIGLAAFGASADEASKKLENLQAKVADTRGAMNDKTTTLKGLDEEIQKYIDRSAGAAATQTEVKASALELEQRFGQFGIKIDNNVSSINDLVAALINLKVALQPDTLNLPGQLASNLLLSVKQMKEKAAADFNPKAALSLIGDAPGSVTGGKTIDRFGVSANPNTLKVRGQTVPALSEALSLIADGKNLRSFSDYAQIQKQLSDLALAEPDKKLSAYYDKVRGEIEKLAKLANIIKGRTLEAEVNNKRQAENTLSAPFAEGAERTLADLQQRLASGRVEINRNKNAIERDVQYTKLSADIEERITKYLQGVSDTATSEQKAAFDRKFGPGFEALKNEIRSYGETLSDKSRDALITLYKGQAKAAEDDAKELAGKVDQYQAPQERVEFRKKIEQFLEAKRTFALKAFDLETKALERSGDYNRGLRDLTRKELQRDLGTQAETFRNSVFKRYDDPFREVDPARANLLALQTERKRIADESTKAARATELAQRAGADEIGAVGLSQNVNRISGAQLFAMNKKQEALETKTLADQVSIYADEQRKLEEQTRRVNDEEERLLSVRINAEARMADRIDTEENFVFYLKAQQDADKDLQKAQEDLNKLQEEGRATTSSLEAATIKLAEARARLKSRTDEIREFSLTETIQASMDQYAQTAGLLDTTNKKIGDGLQDVFRKTQDGFKQLVIDMTSGTTSIGGAFKNMAKSILASMQELAANELSKQFMGLIFGLGKDLLGSAFGPSTSTPAPVVPAGQIPGVTFASGGRITGGIRGRDSVPIFAMPDEHVMTTKATSAVGHDFLDDINKRGMAAVQDAAGSVTQINQMGGGGQVNVWVVSKDQQPPPGPRDVVAMISEDILQGGNVKKLIKQVNMGAI